MARRIRHAKVHVKVSVKPKRNVRVSTSNKKVKFECYGITYSGIYTKDVTTNESYISADIDGEPVTLRPFEVQNLRFL